MTGRASVHSDLGSRDIDNRPLKKLSKKESCIKCQKGGNVLVCNDSDCPIVVHESCMSNGARFDDNGKFFCPYCFYKQSVSECRQAKEKALLTKEKLSRFLDMNNDRNNGNLERYRSLKRKEPDSPTNMQNRNDGSGSKVETDEAGHQRTQGEGGQKDLETLTGYEQEAGAPVSSHCLEKGTASRTYENLSKKPQETVKILGSYHNGSRVREQAQEELQEASVYLETKENTTNIHEESPKGSDSSTSRDDSCVRSQIALTPENTGQPAENGQTPEKSSENATHPMKKHNHTMHQETSVCRTRKGETVDMHEECDKGKHSTFQVDCFVRSPREVNSGNVVQSGEIEEGRSGRAGKEKTQIQLSIGATNSMRKDNVSVAHEISEASTEGSHGSARKLEGYRDGGVEKQQREACEESSFSLTRRENVENIHEESDQGNDSMGLDEVIMRNQMADNEENADEPADIGRNHYGITNEVQKQIKLPENGVHTMPDDVSVTLEESEAGDNNTISSQDSYDIGHGTCSKWKGKMPETLKNAYQPRELSESSEMDLSELKEHEEVTSHATRQKVDGAKEIQRPSLPSTRRRKLPWTLEEVEMLKEGVQKFLLVANKNLPWTKILDFGRHIFDGTRTPIDLKDKWRNLMGKGGHST